MDCGFLSEMRCTERDSLSHNPNSQPQVTYTMKHESALEVQVSDRSGAQLNPLALDPHLSFCHLCPLSRINFVLKKDIPEKQENVSSSLQQTLSCLSLACMDSHVHF